jgi:hypothetical protein
VGYIKSSQTNMTGMDLLLGVMFILIVTSICYGMYGNIKVDLLVEINMLDSPYYNLGVFYNRTYEDGIQYIDQLTIGLVLVNLNIIFYKDINA